MTRYERIGLCWLAVLPQVEAEKVLGMTHGYQIIVASMTANFQAANAPRMIVARELQRISTMQL